MFRVLKLLILVLAAAPVIPAFAQAFPSRPITIVVPFSPGGATDIFARILAEKLRDTLGQAVIVENKPGAGGMLGAAAVVKAKSDGYTLLMGSPGETLINSLIYKRPLQYHAERDLVPINLVTRISNVLVANSELPVKDMSDLMAYAQKNPGNVRYGTSGVGNMQHLNGELLQMLTGTQLVPVPYKGTANMLIDVASGSVETGFVAMAGALPFIKSGRIKPLAVTSAKRASFAPDIPTISEYKPAASYDLDNWYGIFAPAGTPQDVQNRLNVVITEALHDPEIIKQMVEQGGNPSPMTQDQFRAFMQAENVKYVDIVSNAKITVD